MSSYLRVLRHRDFRFLFWGQSASAIGDQVVIVALALYITRRTGSPTDLGVVLAAQSLPMILFLLVGGVWADRLPRHRLMLAADGARALLHGTLAALIVSGGATVAEMVVIEALFGTARAFFQPAYTGLIPQTIDDDLVQDAQALTQTTMNVSILVGPALGTVLVVTAGAGVAFALDAATFVLSAVLLIPVRPRPRGPAAERRPLLHELREGFAEVRSRPWVWATIAAFTGAIFCGYTTWYSLAPIIARDWYGSAATFGVLETAGGVGAIAGAVIALRWRPRRPLITGLALGLAWPLQCIALALVLPLGVVMVVVAGTGFGFSLFGVWWETALARHIPPHALSRVSSYDWMGSLALMPLGYAVAGPLAAVAGARTVLGVGGALTFVMLVAAMTPRSTRALDGGASAQELDDDVAVERGGEAEVA